LKIIDSAISVENKKVIALSSTSGSGKTTLANEFGYRFIEMHQGFVHWIKSERSHSVDLEFLKIN
jgi:ABC-type lipoprotein export system ATPase subunit